MCRRFPQLFSLILGENGFDGVLDELCVLDAYRRMDFDMILLIGKFIFKQKLIKILINAIHCKYAKGIFNKKI